ncbi:hypothetical protein Dimus_002249 [Dionaea muscipula]
MTTQKFLFLIKKGEDKVLALGRTELESYNMERTPLQWLAGSLLDRLGPFTLVDEEDQFVDEGEGIVRGWAEEVEDMALPLGLHQLSLSLPIALRQHLLVQQPPVSEEVLLRHQNQHPLAAHQLQIRVRGRVYPRIVQSQATARANNLPERVHPPHPSNGADDLLPDRLFPSEERMHQNDAAETDAGQSFHAGPDPHVVGDRGAGAVSGEEDPREIGMIREPGFHRRRSISCEDGGVGLDPLESGPGVVEGGREWVLGCPPVVNRDSDKAGFGG